MFNLPTFSKNLLLVLLFGSLKGLSLHPSLSFLPCGLTEGPSGLPSSSPFIAVSWCWESIVLLCPLTQQCFLPLLWHGHLCLRLALLSHLSLEPDPSDVLPQVSQLSWACCPFHHMEYSHFVRYWTVQLFLKLIFWSFSLYMCKNDAIMRNFDDPKIHEPFT